MKDSLKKYTIIPFLFMFLGAAACSDAGTAAVTTEPVSFTAVATVPPVEQLANQNPPPPAATAAVSAVAAATADISEVMAIALAQEQAFIHIYEQLNPAVVHIRVNSGEGSGFIYDLAGHIVTNNHVVDGANQIMVIFADGSQAAATVIGSDPASDLAVLRVNVAAQRLKAVTLADSDSLRVGQIVAAIGSPFGLESTMTTGIISALNRLYPGTSTNFQIPDIIQTDAAINPGNSGGPLIDLQGRVIGVNSAIESPVRGSSGIGYAVPANIVANVVPQLIASGQVAHPWLGISGAELTPNNAADLGFDAGQRGVYISSVTTGSPAAVAGLVPANTTNGQGGDVIIGIDDVAIANFDDLLGYIVQYTAVGQTVELTVLRNNQSLSVTLRLQARPTGT